MFKMTIYNNYDIWVLPAQDATIAHKHKREVNVLLDTEKNENAIRLVKNFVKRLDHEYNDPGMHRLIKRILSFEDDEFIKVPYLEVFEGACRIEVIRIRQPHFHYTLKG